MKSKPKKMGRPSLGAAARRRFVTVKFTDAEYDAICAAAERESLVLTAWLRAAADLAIARGSTR